MTLESWFSTGNQESPHRPILRGGTEPGCVNGPNVPCCRMKHAPLQLYGLSPDVVHHPDMHEKMSEGDKSWGLLFYSRRRRTVCTALILHNVRIHTNMPEGTVESSSTTCSDCCIWTTVVRAELQVCVQLRWIKKMCNAKAIVNDGFYSAGLELHPMWKSLTDVRVHCEGNNHSVSWVAWASATWTHAVKPVQYNSHMYCKAHPSAVRAWIIQSHLSLFPYAPSYLPVQDKQTLHLAAAVNISLRETQRDRISPRQVLQALSSLSCPPSARPFSPKGPVLHPRPLS